MNCCSQNNEGCRYCSDIEHYLHDAQFLSEIARNPRVGIGLKFTDNVWAYLKTFEHSPGSGQLGTVRSQHRRLNEGPRSLTMGEILTTYLSSRKWVMTSKAIFRHEAIDGQQRRVCSKSLP